MAISEKERKKNHYLGKKNEKRISWQSNAKINGDNAEDVFGKTAKLYFSEEKYVVRTPKKEDLLYIGANPGDKYHRIGDRIIENTVTKKRVMIENKYQGWGGNAHERMYRFFPGTGLHDMAKEKYGTKNPVLFVLSGPFTENPSKLSEFDVMFKKHQDILLINNDKLTVEERDAFFHRIKEDLE